MSSKVVVIGIDGGTFDLIDKFDLPFLAKLRDEGTWGNLKSLIPPVTAPAWVSFLTGKNPGKHGVFEFMGREEDSYRFTPVNSASVKTRSLVDILSLAGKRSIMINVPVTYPPRQINGLCITGLLTPGTESDYTFPRELKDKISREIGDYIITADEIFSPGREEEFLTSLEKQIAKRTELTLYLLNNYQWDFLMVVFNATDNVQHGLWGYTDRKSHTYKFPQRKKYADGIKRIYRKVDQSMEKLYRRIDRDTNIIVMSDHGAGPLYWFFHVNVFLLQKGYLKIKKNAKSRFKLLLFKAGFTLKNVFNLAYRLGLARSRKLLDAKRTRRNLLTKLFLSFEDVDWDRTTAYSRGIIGQMFINLKGREPRGTVERGGEHQRLIENIISDLKELRRPDDGSNLIVDIYRPEDIYQGSYAWLAPDITFLTRNMETVAFGNFEFSSHRFLERAYTGISGHHRMEGIYIFNGPAFRNLRRHRELSLIDLAPLILYLLDFSIDKDMDGVLPEDVIDPDYTRTVRTKGK